MPLAARPIYESNASFSINYSVLRTKYCKNIQALIISSKTTMNLNGPRIGATYTGGSNGECPQSSKEAGGYNMFPVTMFGFLFEKQYLSSRDFQVLLEVIVSVKGLESGMIIPSVSFLNGFRISNSEYEFGEAKYLGL